MADEPSLGQAATPLEAPALSLRQGRVTNFPFPATGWTVVSNDGETAVLRQGKLQLNVRRGKDATWHVQSGYECQPSTPSTVRRVTVVNDTAVPVRVLCAACGPMGIVLASRERRVLPPGDLFTFKRPGRTSCVLFGEPTGRGNPPTEPAPVKVSQAGNCPTQ